MRIFFSKPLDSRLITKENQVLNVPAITKKSETTSKKRAIVRAVPERYPDTLVGLRNQLMGNERRAASKLINPTRGQVQLSFLSFTSAGPVIAGS